MPSELRLNNSEANKSAEVADAAAPLDSRDQITRALNGYATPERTKSFAWDMLKCGPPAVAVGLGTAPEGIGVGILAWQLAICVPNLLADILPFPSNFISEIHQGTSMSSPAGIGSTIVSGLITQGDRVLDGADLGKSLFDLFSLGRNYFGIEHQVESPNIILGFNIADHLVTDFDKIKEMSLEERASPISKESQVLESHRLSQPGPDSHTEQGGGSPLNRMDNPNENKPSNSAPFAQPGPIPA